MTGNELIKELKKHKDKNILIKIKGGLFYPPIELKQYDNNIIIICKDITKVDDE